MNYQKHNLKQEYLKQSVMTANPAELIVMMLDACMKNLKLAEIRYVEQKDIDGANNHMLKAQQIIMELVNCLDATVELSAHLLKIYDFLLWAMRDMNTRKDFTQLPDVLELLASMRDSWEQIAKPRYSSSEVS